MDHYSRSALNFFAANPLDRMVEKRRHREWLAAQLDAATSRFVPVWRMQNLFQDAHAATARLLTAQELPQALAPEAVTLLGSYQGVTYFAVDVEEDVAETPPDWVTTLGTLRDLRMVGTAVDPMIGALLAYARAMIYWERRHRFCGDCGHPTSRREGGFVRFCTNEACGKQIFPRTDPAIIVLVQSEDRCLLARQASWPPGRYSVIAGFVEPGESLEDAVKREIREETSIEVEAIHYHSSQPWPFPSSLMLGFMATATTTAFNLYDNELEDARWLTRAQLTAEIQAGTLKLPTSLSISRRLIETWFDAGDQGPLRAIAPDTW
ncbi:MAG: NAD(+) diphosphatase [Caldilineaceae bacterium]|nr:NAD(+) diphosphatase [Caldilineaceae bacterium]